MKKTISQFTFTLILLSGLSFITISCGSKTEKKMEMTEEQASDEASDDVVYACPMHLEITGKKGDKCSKCNMDLVEVKNEGDSTMMHDHH